MGNFIQLGSIINWALFIAIPVILVLDSCSTSNSVVSNRLVQKRKYTKGWHFNSRHHQRASEGNTSEQKYPASIEAIQQEREPSTVLIMPKKETFQHRLNKEPYTKVMGETLDSSFIQSDFVAKKKNEQRETIFSRSRWTKGSSKYIPVPSIAMTMDEKGQLFAFIALMVGLLIIAGFLMHLIGPWTIANAGLLIMWILLLTSAATAVVKNEKEVNAENMRPLFRASNIFMHWFFKVFFVLLIVAGGLIALGLIIAFIIDLMGVATFIISTFGIVIGIIVIVILVISGVLYFADVYPELFWIATTALLLGVVFYSLYLAAPMYLALLVLGYTFLIAGALLVLTHIILSFIELS